MAEGLLVVLKGEECRNAKQYYNLEKTYEYSFIVGIGTDTYDSLGKITKIHIPKKDVTNKVTEAVKTLTQKQNLPYPPYSSKTVNGTPLFEYARKNKIKDITLPTKTVHIKRHEITDVKIITTETLTKKIIENIKKVNGDFRQKKILHEWEQIKNGEVQQFFAQIDASSGTYVRSIVHKIGEKIGCPTTATSIQRTKIGTWTKIGTYGQ